jgi:two-component system, NarL family, response regulator
VVASATDGEKVSQLYYQFLPDVLILDLRLPKKDGLQVLNDLMASGRSKPRVMIITTFDCEEAIFKAVRAGAKGYLVKDMAPQQIRESVRRVAAGESVLSSNFAAKLAESIARPQLSRRERQVLKYLANGRSNKEIAQVLYLSEHTAKAHVRVIMTKLNADSRAAHEC